MNMGTPGWPESLEHFGTKAAMLSLFRTAIPRGAIWAMVREPQHDRCTGGPVVVNLTAGVTDAYVELPYAPGGFVPDITLQRQDPHLPTFIEVEVSSPASKRKVDYCANAGINVFTAYGLAPVDNNSTVRLLKLGVETMRCHRKERHRMNALWSHLCSLSDDDDCRFGVEQSSPHTVKYIVGTRTVGREDLLTLCMLHLFFIEDMEVRHGGAATGEHGDRIRYSRKALDADDTIREVVNRVEYQNGVTGPRVSPEQAETCNLRDVFWYPRRWGLRPSPDAYRRTGSG